MLTQSGINAVYSTADELAARGVRLIALPNTPLSELTSVSLKHAVSCAAGGVETAPDFSTSLMEGANRVDEVGHNTHDEIMANAVQAVGQAINFNTQLAKNTVNPAIERVATSLSTALESFSGAASVPVQIAPVYDRDFWSLPYTQELFSRYGETVASRDVAYTGPAIPYNPEFLETRLESFDLAIREYVNQLMDGASQTAEHYWNASFGRGPFNVRDILTGGREVIDAAIVVYLGAQYLSGNPPEGTEMSASAWETMCRQVMAQAGLVVNSGLARIERDRRLGLMVISYPQSHAVGEKIFVDGPTYGRFLNEGGTPEAVLGAFFDSRPNGAEQIFAEREAYTARWNATQSTLISEAVGQRLNAVIRALDVAVTDEINQMPEEALPVDRAALHERLREHLGTVRSANLDNLWLVARRAVCQVIYPHTDAEETLEAIDEQMRMRPELNVREAALYAMIDRLAQWLAKLVQVEVVRI